MRLAVVVALLGCLATAGRADPALEAAEARTHPDGALAWFKAGVELAQRGEWAAALNRFQRARQLSPNWALPHVEIAVAHLMTDNDRAVIGASLARAVELGPEIPRARYLLGVFLHEQGERIKAMHEFVEALKRRPSLIDARYRLATLYVEEGQQADGVHQFELVLKQQASHLGAHRNLAVLFEQSGQLEQSEQHWQAIVENDPRNAWHLNNLARFYDRVGWDAKARQAQQRAERLDPTRDRRNLRPLLKSRN
jgi:tetratricopeptide (TPR) repeat protein